MHITILRKDIGDFHLWNADFRLTGMVISNGRTGDGFHSGILTLKGVNTEIRNTQSQLRDADKLLKLDPGNMELLAQKHRLNVLKELMIVLKRLAYLSLTQINALDVGFVQDNVQWKLSQ